MVWKGSILFTNNLSECWCRIINPYLFTKFSTSKHFGKRVTQHAYSQCSLLWCENGIVDQQVIGTLVSYHESLPVYKVSYIEAFRYESYTNMHVHKFNVLCCGAKRVLFTNKLSVCWCRISIPYLITKFHASKDFGKRVTQTCMPYCNVRAEVVYCGFPKSKVFTKTLISLYIPCVSPKSIPPPSFICGCTLVSEIREFNQKKKKKKMNNSEKEFDTFPIVKKSPFLTNCSFDGIVTMM